MKQLIWIFYLLSIGIALTSCDSSRVYEDYVKISDSKWRSNDTLRFKVEISDTIQKHNIYLNIRNTGAYAYSNLWVFVKTIAPDGEVKHEKFECQLANKKGKWFGSGFGNLFDLQIPFRQQVVFSHSGTYVFEIVQGMRTNVLKEVADIGIRIEKANQ